MLASCLQRQLDPKSTPLPGLGLHADPAAHEFDGFADRRQAEPDSWKLLFCIDSHKRHENTLLIFLGNTNAVIADLNAADILRHRSRYCDLRPHASRHKLDCIRQQIRQSDFEQCRIGLNGTGLVRIDVDERDLLLF